MKKVLLFTVILFFAAAFSVRAQTTSSRNEKLAAELLILQKAQEDAENKKDVVALERIFNDDFIFFAANGAIYDKKKFLDEIKADAEPPSSAQTLDYENFTARAYGKTAIVNYVLAVSNADKDGKTTVGRYRMSVVRVKMKGAWRIANFHSTRVRQ